MKQVRFRDATLDDIAAIAGLHNAGAGGFYARCGFAERGRVVYKGNPLIYYERLLR